jgi:nitrate/nitrite transporter NarK
MLFLSNSAFEEGHKTRPDRPVTGRLSDRIEPRLVASIGMALTTAGLTMLTFLNEKTPRQEDRMYVSS